ncbi:hypothetical protein D9M71_293040 [compost metagenome]
MLRAQGDLALQAHLAQRQIGVAEAAAAGGNVDVGQRHVFVEADPGLRHRMALAHGADVAVFQQLDVAYLRIGVQWCVHGEVEAAGGQFGGHLPAPGEEALDVHVRRLPAQALEQQRQDDGLGEVGHADAVGLVRLGGGEGAAFLHRHAQQLQGVAHRADDVLRHRRRHHALRRTHEQRIVEGFAQAGEGVGDGGLGDADDLPGTGQVGFGIDRVEHDEQVEVDFTEVHAAAPLVLVVGRSYGRVSATIYEW